MYDVDAKVRKRRLELQGVGLSVHVTQDDEPLLLVSAADPETLETSLDVYDAITGEHLRAMTEFGDVAFQFVGLPSAAGERARTEAP